MNKKLGRPDTPLEAARRTASTLQLNLRKVLGWLAQPTGDDAGRDLSSWIADVERALDSLDADWGGSLRNDAPIPESLDRALRQGVHTINTVADHLRDDSRSNEVRLLVVGLSHYLYPLNVDEASD